MDAPTTIFEDNQGAIDLVNNPVHHRRTKHIDVRYHYIRSKQDDMTVVVKKVHTDNNLADFLTKALNIQKFVKMRDAIMHSEIAP